MLFVIVVNWTAQHESVRRRGFAEFLSCGRPMERSAPESVRETQNCVQAYKICLHVFSAQQARHFAGRYVSTCFRALGRVMNQMQNRQKNNGDPLVLLMYY